MRTLLLCWLLGLAVGLPAQTYTGKIAPRLQTQLEQYPQTTQRVLLLLEDREDMYALEAELAQATLAARSRRVITRLQQRAAATQPALLRDLRNAPGVHNATGYWVINAIFADMTPAAVHAAARDARVALLDLDVALAVEALTRTTAAAAAPSGTEAGLRAVNAPALWALGYTGAGRVGMINDTGTNMEHPALAGRYLGGYTNDTLAFFDQADRVDNTYDCGSHGTHVAGTMLGLDLENADTIGVAFNANWTAAAILCGLGTEDNINSFQWALNPDGDSTTTADMPDVINNSWYDPSLDTTDCESYYVPLLQAVEAAGIAVVFSAGNAGPDPLTITPPHNINTDIVNSFTVAAVNGNSAALSVADFSSRGPSQCGGAGSLLIKPEVSAPGVNVRSCIPGGDYALFSGTSMAAPHVSGVVLLLKEAFPYLTGRELKLALYYSAVDLGATGEDNVYGNGMIDARRAYDYLLEQGHVPVPPAAITNDLVLLSFSKEVRYCDATVVAGTAKVFNNGLDTVGTFELDYSTDASGETVVWSGQLAPGAWTEVALPELPMQPVLGSQLISLAVRTVGSTDDLPRNNRIRRRIRVTDRPSPVVSSSAGPDNLLCAPGSALLSATTADPAAAGFSWYASADDEPPLATGASYVPPAVATSTTLYLGVDYATQVGPEAVAPEAAEFQTLEGRGLRFEAELPLTLASVKVYSETAGLRVFQIKGPFGNLIRTVTQSLPVGESRIELDVDVEPGRRYSLVGEDVGPPRPLAVGLGNAAFPYEVPGVMAIVGNTEPENESDYFFFYDWEVTYAEPCGRQAVTLTVTDPMAPAPAAFDLPGDTVRLDNAGEARVFPQLLSGSDAVLWDFGNGQTSTAMAPEGVYTTPGNYRVRLRGTLDACTAYAARDVVVLDQLTARQEVPRLEAKLFPNPTSDVLHVVLSGAAPTTGVLYDATGRLQRRVSFSGELHTLSLGGLAPGMYFFELRRSGAVYRERVVVE